jgi:hypothetical protein
VHIPGVINAADQQTKPLAARLHYRHARRLMGHFGPPSQASSIESAVQSSSTPLPGEGVDAPSSVTPSSPRPSIVRQSVRSCSHGSSLIPTFPRDLCHPMPPACCPCGTGCQPSSCSSRDIASGSDCPAPTDPCSASQDFGAIGLFPSCPDPPLDSS